MLECWPALQVEEWAAQCCGHPAPADLHSQPASQPGAEWTGGPCGGCPVVPCTGDGTASTVGATRVLNGMCWIELDWIGMESVCREEATRGFNKHWME